MANLRKINSFSSFEEDLREALTPKKTFSDFFCAVINYVSLVPTVIVNTIYIYFITKELTSRETETSSPCFNVNNSILSILNWNVIALIKALCFLFLRKFCCGNENDCNIFCLFLKVITSYIPCFYFIYEFEYIETITDIECKKEIDFVFMFYKLEKIYFYFVSSIFALIPVGMIGMVMKELWKSRKYQDKSD